MAEFTKLSGLDVCDEQAREDIKLLKSEDVKLKNQIESGLSTKESLKDKLVVFGDSWSAPNVTDAIWSGNVAESLNLTLHNYAKDGAGFLLDTHSLISTQISTFINDSLVDKTKVKYIVLVGGLNDYRYSYTYAELSTAIINCISTLEEVCPQAKILYVSNCEYPFTKNQSWYWKNVHLEINTNKVVSTYNMDGTLRRGLFNLDNYYHLSQQGQNVMGKNIIACLTGGQITSISDSRTISNDTMSIIYNIGKISNDCVGINMMITPKTSSTAYNVSLTDDTLPDIPYASDLNLSGATSWSFNNFVVSSTNRTINVNSVSALSNTRTYAISLFLFY